MPAILTRADDLDEQPATQSITSLEVFERAFAAAPARRPLTRYARLAHAALRAVVNALIEAYLVRCPRCRLPGVAFLEVSSGIGGPVASTQRCEACGYRWSTAAGECW